MKKILFLLTIAAAFMLSSCDKESSLGVSKVTTYATMTLTGAPSIYWQLGTNYTDPGLVAMEGTTNISSKVETSGLPNVNVGGFYTITYSVANSDGFKAYATRKVIVTDLTDPLNGFYSSALTRNNISANTTSNRGPYSTMVFAVGGGKYYISDLIGGWYNIGSAYGTAYAGPGIVLKHADNSVTLVSASSWTWGPCVITSAGATVDPTTKTWILNTTGGPSLANYTWKVTLSNPVSF
ncbi:MAG: DUF5012 domain-containing protein [Bacteroidia bacterium]|nr:DUF5012 domain-containing protein [Bacteroidia bacterium]